MSSHEVQMRWRDLDALGHVNHPVVLTYLEEGRDAFLAERGIRRDEYVVGRCTVSYQGEIDPAMGPGDCKVSSELGVVDGKLANRLAEVRRSIDSTEGA